ncbi:MAG: hypothetical protein ACR2PR_02890 [Pseudohongiellaceae bacterium]
MLYVNGRQVTRGKTPSSVNKADEKAIGCFLQGAVYCWCDTKGKAKFTAPTFVGGKNWHWGGTPLMKIYEYHLKKQKSHGKAYKKAGIDAGHLLKKVLIKDRRRFDRKTGSGYERNAKYAWDGQYPKKP